MAIVFKAVVMRWPWKSTHETQPDRVVVLSDWPQPAVVAEPQVRADDTKLSLMYRTKDDTLAVVTLPNCTYFIFGAPNDEALGGHRLACCGLQYYSVHEVHESSLIAELERKNSIHAKHNRKWFLEDLKHFIITFQDSTLEFVFKSGPSRNPRISIFNSKDDGLQALSEN
jgi:hypothetical protein